MVKNNTVSNNDYEYSWTKSFDKYNCYLGDGFENTIITRAQYIVKRKTSLNLTTDSVLF